MNNLFERLNERQIEAATATEGYVRIIAGAGSGKTKTLTHRYAYLVRAAGVHPGNVLCVTFTNKAAGEMKRRARSLIGDGYDASLITTYHGFCVRVLREDVGRLFYPQNFPILDEADQKKILEEIYAELEIKLDRASFEKILESIHLLKSRENYVDDLICGRFSDRPGDTLEQTVVRRYMEKQKKIFALDFDDLISFTFAIFEKFPEVLQKWQERLHYIQVDEFQDSSSRELRLIQSLSAVHKNLFVVGDPDQNIYEWRGANMSILVDFDKTFPGTQTVLLNQNYRSTGNILRAANALIARNRNRIPKELFTVRDAGSDVVHLHAKSEEEEGAWIAGEIQRLIRQEGFAFRDIAVLYRSGFLSRFVEQALNAANIPYELYGGLRFYDRMEIRDAVAYLRLIVSNDDAAFERVVNTPKRSFGRKKMTLLRQLAAQDGLSLYEALTKYRTLPEFSDSRAEDFILSIEEARSSYKNQPVSEVVQNILVRSGYEQYIRENGSMERLDNLSEFKRVALELERGYGEFYSLEEFLQRVALQSEKEDDETEIDRVKLMTIHASKGLEFPVCFVCGFTEGVFPSARTMEERKEAGLEEERRLCFVAMTRAMKRLYLTESEGTSGQSPRKKQPSRFIFEIGEERYRRIGTIPKELADSVAETLQASAAPPAKAIGSAVEHPVFGRGVITDLDTKKRVYSILFEKTNSLKPIDMDYDFDAWKNLAEMKRTALEAAAKELETAANQAPAPEAPAEIPATEIPAATPGVAENSPITATETATETPATPGVAEKYRAEDWANAIDDGEENLWKRADVPHDGWVCIDVIDLGAPVGVCRMCGRQIIRYVHVMFHPNYPRRIGAGCVCAGRMEGDVDAARERENAVKNRLARRETFLKTPLKRSRNGNEYMKYKGEIVTLLKDKYREGRYKTAFRNSFSASCPTREEALSEAFDKIDPPIKMG